jgi:hypothetical protein
MRLKIRCDRYCAKKIGCFRASKQGLSRFSHAYVYSSEADEWSQAASIEDRSYVELHCTHSALVGNALYFRLKWNNGILEYDLAKEELSVIGLPPICKVSTVLVLMSVEDDGLGFAMVHDDFSLCIWLRESAPTSSGGWTWTRHRVVDLKSFLPVCALSSSPYIVAAADAIGVFVIRAGRDDGVLAIDLKSSQVRKVSDANGHIVNIIPYISFCTPGNFLTCPRPS